MSASKTEKKKRNKPHSQYDPHLGGCFSTPVRILTAMNSFTVSEALAIT